MGGGRMIRKVKIQSESEVEALSKLKKANIENLDVFLEDSKKRYLDEEKAIEVAMRKERIVAYA